MITIGEYTAIINKLENQIIKPTTNEREQIFYAMSVAAILLDFTDCSKDLKEDEYKKARKKYIEEFKSQMN